MAERFRCSLVDSGEPLAGTAAVDSAFLLIEHPGPWGNKALAESRLPEHVRTGVANAAEQAGVRVQLIRRYGRTEPIERFRVFLGNSAPDDPWVETTVLDVADDLLDLDLDGLAAGRRPGLQEHRDPLLLVCTNGRRDACCAEFGRPAAAALRVGFPAETWETSHLGGHRFAVAVLTLPYGFSYGRLDVPATLRVGELTREGRVDTAHLRGRTAYAPEVQAAEIALLDALGLDRVDAVRLVEVVPDADAGVVESTSRVVFEDAVGTRHLVDVVAATGPAIRASCGDEKIKATTSHVATVVSRPAAPPAE